MEGHCSTGQSRQWAVVPMEEEEESSSNAKDVPYVLESNPHLFLPISLTKKVSSRF